MRTGREKCEFNNESHKGIIYEYHTYTPSLEILIPSLVVVAKKGHKAAGRRPEALHLTFEGPLGHRL